MNSVMQLINQQIMVKVTGGNFIQGIFTDIGNDILVLFDGQRYRYIPLIHVHKIKLSSQEEEEISQPTGNSLIQQEKEISYRSILTNAKGLFTEIQVSGKQPLYGYITGVLSDYFVFNSPIYQTVYIPLTHLKWLTLHDQNATPYTITSLPIQTQNPSRSFEEQLKKLEDNLVVFDLGEDQDKIGLLKKIENNLIELITANGETVILNPAHVKSVYVP